MNTTVEQLRTQANEFLTYVSTEVVGQVLGADLPLIGNTLLNSLLAPGANTLLAGLRQTINEALDEVDGAGATLAQNIATKLDGLDGVVSSATGTLVTIDIATSDSLENLKAQGLDVDIGWDALGLALKGGAKADMAFDVDAKLTFDVATGELRLFDTDDKLATVTLTGALNGSGEGKLGFIDITATDQFTSDELSVTGTVDFHPTGGSILVTDLADASADDFQLTLKGAAETNLGLSVDLSTDLLPKITTDLLAKFSFDYDSAKDEGGFITTTSIDLANITLDVGSIVGLLGDVFGPIIDNVFGAFPIKQLLGTLTTPLPLIDGGIKALDLFDDFNIIKDENINLLDLAGFYLIATNASTETINTFARAYSLIKAIDGLQAAANTTSVIELGGYHIYGPQLPAMAVLPEGTAQGIMALAGASPLDTLGKALDEAGGPPTPGDGLGNPAGLLSDILEGSGLSLPILQVETIAKLLTAGNSTAAIDLIKYDIPALTFDANFHKFFPIIGPIGVAFDGGFGAKLDVDIGYDSRGLMAPDGNIADGFYFTTALDETQNPPAYLPAGHVEAGVYASAAVNVGIGEAGVGGGIVAELNAYLDTKQNPKQGKLYLTDLLTGDPCIFDPISGEFSVRVRAYVTVGVDPFSYTKRFDLVKKTLADFSFGCPPPVPTDDMGLATIKGQASVAYINAGDRAGLRAINGVKGTDTIGKDADEYFFVEQRQNGSLLITAFGLSDINGHPKKGGKADDDIAPTKIIANMGNGDDQMVLEDHVATPATMTGGDGDDLLGGGLGEDTLDGGKNSDRLIGGGAKDTLLGGLGDDYLEGGAGPDTLNGGDDIDQVTYENSAEGVIFNPNGKQGGYVGTGGEAEGDTLISIEQITGSHYDDQLIGNQKQGSLLEGLDGVDVLQGGAADDLLIGGGRGDTLSGGGGNDTVSYLTSAGQVSVLLGLGFGFGGDATGDGYTSIENVQGSAGDDRLFGNASSNQLMGWYGDDTLAGNVGFDTVYAGGGDDIVYALGDGDLLDGDGETKLLRGNYYNPGNDLLSYENASKGVNVALALYKVDDDGNTLSVTSGYAFYNKQFFRDRIAVNVVKIDDRVLGNSTFENLTGSKYKDSLTGDYQKNVIRGLTGNDTIDGSNGDDTLIGGVGADTLIGGDGRDLADYQGSGLGVTVTLADADFGSGLGGDAAGDQLTGIEDLRGSDRADQLTGNTFNNRIDPGLSRFDGKADKVDGGAGYDTLVLDWSLADTGKGMIGGYAHVPATQTTLNGAFARQEAKSTNLLDSVTFGNVESLYVIGTSKADIITGGAGTDTILGGDGNDGILTGIGFAWLDPNDHSKGYDYLKGGITYDFISGGAGNDVIAVNTGSDGNLSLFGGTRFGLIEGGAGIDVLNASFTVALSDITLLGKLGTTEFHGKNYASPDGSAIIDMEVLGIVATGFGDDILYQPGRYNNVFATGFGRDLTDAGLGKDVVDGGLDFVYNSDVVVSDSDPQRLETTTLDFATVFSSDGDHLDVDYTNGTAGITSSVSVVNTGFTLARPGDSTVLQIATNNGYFQSGQDRVDFSNIENVSVIGTKFADQIFGTSLTYGVNRRAGEANALLASASARGDDILFGNGGNDVIFGGTGDDLIRGGDGDDVLLGTAYPTSRTLGPVDLGEVDRLEGGAGRDVFLLGTMVVLYNDQASDGQSSHRRVSSENHAELRDFDAKFDTIVLSALPTNGTNRRPYTAYDAVVQDGDTYIYLKDGVATPDGSAASHNELIAIVRGVTDLNLVSKYVIFMQPDGSYVYGNGSPATPPPVLTPAAAGGAADAESARPAMLADHSQAFAHADVTASLPRDSVAAAAADVAGWVKQTGDAAVLRSALFKGDPVLGAGTLTVDGNSAAVGIFQGDPFGLGSGVVLSTGRVLDLPGVNTIDGGRATANEANLKFEFAGIVPGEIEGQFSRIYRADLSGLGFDLNSIKLGDASGGFGGAGGEFSGFDIDAVALSTELRTFTFNDADVFNTTMKRIDAFDFDLGSVKYTPGNLRAPVLADTELRGQQNGLPVFDAVSLDRVDGDASSAGRRALTLGEGGSIGFDLNQTVSTKGPLYLYVAEAGAAGEQLSTGLTASVNRLEAPSDLSTDLGRPGIDGDTTTLTYTFKPRVTDGSMPNTIAFDVVFFSEEFAEFAEKGFNDKFKVMLNGVELARLSDGSFASIDTLYTANAGPSARTSIYALRTDSSSADLVYNPVGTGPAADRTHADGFSKVLHLVGNIDPTGTNTLTIQVSDEGDPYLDSGILIRGGSFETETTGRFTIDRSDRPVHEGETRTVAFGIDVPEGTRLTDPVSVLFIPPDDIDLGEGFGRPYQVTLNPGETEGHITYTVLHDAVIGNSRFEAIGVTVRGLPGTETIAPLVISIDDSSTGRGYSIGNAPVAYDRADPGAWARAWSFDGLAITHTPGGREPYTAVDFDISSPDTIAGSDMLAGDLGVSGVAGTRTANPQELGGTERLKFDWASADVDAVTLHFNLWDRGDVAVAEFYDAAGTLLDTRRTADPTLAIEGLDNVATMVLTAATGSFVIDAVDVHETVGRSSGNVPASAFVTDDVDVDAGFWDTNHGRWSPGGWLEPLALM